MCLDDWPDGWMAGQMDDWLVSWIGQLAGWWWLDDDGWTIFEWGQWPAGEQEPPGVAGLPWTMTNFNWSSSFGDDDNDDHDNDTFDNDDDSDDNDDNDVDTW